MPSSELMRRLRRGSVALFELAVLPRELRFTTTIGADDA